MKLFCADMKAVSAVGLSLGLLAGNAFAVTVTTPDVILTSFGSDAAGHYGVHTLGGFGSFTQETGTTTANDGDALQLIIRPEDGKQFRLDTSLLNRAVVSAEFETLNPVFGGTTFRGGLGTVQFNNVQGGVAPSIVPIVNVNDRPFVTGPANTPTGFYGQVTANASHSNGEPFTSAAALLRLTASA